MSEYVTTRGIRLEVGRLPRRAVDEFLAKHPMPEPPTRTVQAFGDIEEEVEDYDAPGYRSAILDYYVWLMRDQVSLIAPAIEVLDDVDLSEIKELQAIGLDIGDDAVDLLRYIVLADDEDKGVVAEIVLYNSTVTVRGLREAGDRFRVTWRGRPVDVLSPPRGPARAAQLFGDRQAALEAGYKWDEFCELPGPEQSEIAAFHRLSMRLTELTMKRGA